MGDEQLRLYRILSRTPFPKSYVGKVFLTAFIGTHLPLLSLLFYFVRHRRFGLGGAMRILSVSVPATLGGTVLTLWAMYSLSAPTALASRALRRYLDSGELPDLEAPASTTTSDFYFISREDPEAARDTIVDLVANRIPSRFGFQPRSMEGALGYLRDPERDQVAKPVRPADPAPPA